MKNEFKLKKVTIVIDQTQEEREKGMYYLRAVDFNSPIEIFGTATQVSEQFYKWLRNTIDAMDKNNCRQIKMELTWE